MHAHVVKRGVTAEAKDWMEEVGRVMQGDLSAQQEEEVAQEMAQLQEQLALEHGSDLPSVPATRPVRVAPEADATQERESAEVRGEVTQERELAEMIAKVTQERNALR